MNSVGGRSRARPAWRWKAGRPCSYQAFQDGGQALERRGQVAVEGAVLPVEDLPAGQLLPRVLGHGLDLLEAAGDAGEAGEDVGHLDGGREVVVAGRMPRVVVV